MKILGKADIDHALSKQKDWRTKDGTLYRVFYFHTFAQAIHFVNQIAQFSEEIDHHPEIGIRFTEVSLALATKSAGGITQLDIDWIEKWTNRDQVSELFTTL